MKKKSQKEVFGPRVKSSVKDRHLMRVEIRHIPMPDAESRLLHAIDLLLRPAAGELEGSINGKKEEEPPKDSRPEKIAGQSDGEKKDESQSGGKKTRAPQGNT